MGVFSKALRSIKVCFSPGFGFISWLALPDRQMWVVCPQGLLPPLRLLPPQPHRAAAQLPHAAAHKTLAQHGASEHVTAGGAAQACLACQHHKVQAGTSLPLQAKKNYIFSGIRSQSDFQGNP